MNKTQKLKRDELIKMCEELDRESEILKKEAKFLLEVYNGRI